MTCPWCDFEGEPRQLHAHLAGAHPEEVRFEERASSRWYQITCPVCGDGYEHVVKPRGRDERFMEQFQAEIRLVAFDMLVNHLLAEHGEPAEAREPG